MMSAVWIGLALCCENKSYWLETEPEPGSKPLGPRERKREEAMIGYATHHTVEYPHLSPISAA